MKALIYTTTTLSIILFACTTSEVAQKENKAQEESNKSLSKVNPLDFDPGATAFKVSADRADTIFTSKGSTILFEANSFVDKNGKPIKGKVDVEWQEFHTLGDIIASGIPMKYDSAGVAYDLESGGMFTINAKYKGQEVNMAPGKSAEVNLASLQDTPCYNFYKLDEKSGDWDYKTTANGTSIESKQGQAPAKPKATIFDMQLNTKSFPELAETELVGWKCMEDISQAQKSWIRQSQTKVRLAEKVGDLYVLEAKDKKNSLKVKVSPYTKEQASADSKVNAIKMNREAEEVLDYARRSAEGKVVRSIEITGFGTYNWDIINKRENSLPLFATFEYPDGTNTSLVTLRLISPDENVVVAYNATSEPMFSFDPNKRNVLVGILPNNELVSASDADFNGARSKEKGAKHTFKLKKTGIKLSSPEDIMKHLNKLI